MKARAVYEYGSLMLLMMRYLMPADFERSSNFINCLNILSLLGKREHIWMPYCYACVVELVWFNMSTTVSSSCDLSCWSAWLSFSSIKVR